MTVLTYGGVIMSLKTPDRHGRARRHRPRASTTSRPTSRSRRTSACLIGRYGNRIAKGKFTLDGKTYTLATNNGANHLHGGAKGWDKVVWASEPFQNADGVGVVLTHTSADGDEGYPGTLKAKVTYTLTDKNELIVDYEATTDKATVINLTQHSYFNLAGAKANDILGHELMLNADAVHAGGRHADSDGRDRAGGGHAVRLPDVDGDRRAHRREERAADARQGLRPQLRADAHGRTAWSTAARVVEPMTGPHADDRHDRAGDPVLLRQFPGRHDHRARAGACIRSGRASASRRSTTRTRRTTRTSRAPTLRPGETYKTQTVFTFGK